MCHQTDFDAHVADITSSIHWTWETTDADTGDTVGKYFTVNNYCVAVPSNEPRCTSCHIGIGWNQSTDIRGDSTKVDCLVCHDGTGTYKKNPTGAGAPLNGDTLDYQAILQSFQTPDRDNCGVCHFFGGGGEGVKHGTMDASLAMPTEATDVHMGGSSDMTCVDCHSRGAANTHDIIGSRYSKASHDAALCQDCHTDPTSGAPQPTHSSLAPKHFNLLACQTCHVPAMARGGSATKTYWDWETAGNFIPGTDDLGNPIKIDRVIRNGDGDIVYHSKKGSFVWGYDIVPEYEWANGNVDHITLNDTIDPNGRGHINVLQSTVEKPGLIFPVKKFIARQPYDTGTSKLVIPHLFPTPEEKAGTETKKAYWMVYDWELAAEAGQAAVGLIFDPVTSDIGFAETDYTWVANHMVAPAADAVQCWECHQSKDRMDMQALGLTGGMAMGQADALNVTYLGYSVAVVGTVDEWTGPAADSSQIIDTGSWMGYLEVSNAPWVYSFNLGKYVYMPEEGGDIFGSWTYFMK